MKNSHIMFGEYILKSMENTTNVGVSILKEDIIEFTFYLNIGDYSELKKEININSICFYDWVGFSRSFRQLFNVFK